jgi:hypothetical protein
MREICRYWVQVVLVRVLPVLPVLGILDRHSYIVLEVHRILVLVLPGSTTTSTSSISRAGTT